MEPIKTYEETHKRFFYIFHKHLGKKGGCVCVCVCVCVCMCMCMYIYQVALPFEALSSDPTGFHNSFTEVCMCVCV